MVCSPPALQSCVQMSTWTWRIEKIGMDMWKVKKQKQLRKAGFTPHLLSFFYLCVFSDLLVFINALK